MLHVFLAADPVYDFLKEQQGGILGSDVKWNFTKFLVGRKGDVVKRSATLVHPSIVAPLLSHLQVMVSLLMCSLYLPMQVWVHHQPVIH